ncbi:MAG: DUF3943 domain-containing protein [Anaeromyxobacter sp.]|nr:DUF3943 domain-containing protein [Anaeromyxobacter sp.]MBL0278539.1 DUF3943 domain-containing protein [Anaeromyxobacter sp.]
MAPPSAVRLPRPPAPPSRSACALPALSLWLVLATPALAGAQEAVGGAAPAPQASGAPAADLAVQPPTAPELRLTPPGAPAVAARPPSWWLPPLELVGVSTVLSLWGRTMIDDPTFHSTWASFKDHLNGPWWYDEDKFATNQFGHPYQGHLYFSTARTLGHGFWVSSAFAFTGSLLWETAGELEPPSVNDQITTTVAGSFLGEILFRLANRVLDDGGGAPSRWRQLGAAAVSPVNGFNRVLHGDRYRPPPEDLPLTGELTLGFQYAGASKQDGTSLGHTQTGLVSAKVVQGHPGSGHGFRAPFDYFDVRAQIGLSEDAGGASATGNFSIHGLLVGAPFGVGQAKGLWGLYGTYDLLTPTLFRASSSALGIGAVYHVPLGGDFLLQGQAILSAGYGAGGSLQDPVGRRDYHFGLQAVVFTNIGVVWRDTLWLEALGREYFVSGSATAESGSWEDMTFSQLDLTWRFSGPHSVKLETSAERRQARYPGLETIDQSGATLGLAYAYQFGETLTFSGKAP